MTFGKRIIKQIAAINKKVFIDKALRMIRAVFVRSIFWISWTDCGPMDFVDVFLISCLCQTQSSNCNRKSFRFLSDNFFFSISISISLYLLNFSKNFAVMFCYMLRSCQQNVCKPIFIIQYRYTKYLNDTTLCTNVTWEKQLYV